MSTLIQAYFVLDRDGKAVYGSDDLDTLALWLAGQWRRGECRGPITLKEGTIASDDQEIM